MNSQCLLTNSCLLKCVLCLCLKHSIFKRKAGAFDFPSSFRCSSAPSHQPGHFVKKIITWCRAVTVFVVPDKFDQIVDFLEKHNTVFNTASQSWNKFSNIVNGTIIAVARPKNLPSDKHVGEIRVITTIDINSWGRMTHICVGKLTINDSDSGCRLDGAKPLS